MSQFSFRLNGRQMILCAATAVGLSVAANGAGFASPAATRLNLENATIEENTTIEPNPARIARAQQPAMPGVQLAQFAWSYSYQYRAPLCRYAYVYGPGGYYYEYQCF